jgi:hypothetical protein
VTFREPCDVRRVLGFEAATVCLKTVIDQCYTEITDEEEDLLFIHAPEVIQRFRSEGSVTDAFLDTLGIPKLPGDRHIDRDGLVPWRRHTYMMSHRYSKENFVNYLQIRSDNNNPVLQQQKKQREQAAKIVRKAEILKEKEDLAATEKALKLAAKDAEKVRRAALTPSEKKAEDLERKLQLLIQKEAKRLDAEEKLARAQALLV